jgi:hypothetical protein
MMTTETAAEPDVFGEFDLIAAVMGFIFHTSGDEGLVELLATIEDPDRTSLQRYAEELDKVRLARAAELVREHAANVQGAGSECPHPAGSANARDWLRRNRRVFSGFHATEDTE